jgi:transcriptional regulator with XRE-family HTH domain
MTYYSKLLQVRTQQNLTQQEIADALSVDQSTYSKYELGKLPLTLDVAKRIAEKFSVDLNWLLNDSTNTYIEKIENCNGVANAIENYTLNNNFDDDLLKQILKQQEILTALLQKLISK